jgi:hypothetical protein
MENVNYVTQYVCSSYWKKGTNGSLTTERSSNGHMAVESVIRQNPPVKF